jgi:peptide/nickel transport system permease protein
VPVIVIGASGTAAMIRRLRANLLDELQKPYVVTAKAKGLPPFRALMKYPLRMSLNPFIADIGNLLPQIISGAAIVSIVMSLPTTGPMLLQALRTQDMYLAGSFLMLLALLTVVGVLLSDLALAALDPRIRFGAGGSR